MILHILNLLYAVISKYWPVKPQRLRSTVIRRDGNLWWTQFVRMVLIACGLVLVSCTNGVSSMFQDSFIGEGRNTSLTPGAPGDMEETSIYLPYLSNTVVPTPTPPLRSRMGYGVTKAGFDTHSATNSLRAGLYLNWTVRIEPKRPQGIEFIQMVRLHQDLQKADPNQAESCELKAPQAHDRMICPYKQPHSYTYSPNAATIQRAARNNPGSTWLIGNEIDRKDWSGGGRQDEILPALYAEAYHELYNLIKGTDPSAMIAIAGMVQSTPLRLQYLTQIWNTYQAKYGTEMPVDIWNSHIFILPEKLGAWGAGIPVGIDETEGAYLFTVDENGHPIPPMPEHLDMRLFSEQVRAFRQWMKERGQQEKPLIVTEYGVLLPNWVIGQSVDDPQAVVNFMLATFDYFLHEKDCSLGYSADECRLVQKWVWYSFDDYPAADQSEKFNKFQALIDPHTSQLTRTGEAFREYSLQNQQELNKPPY